jgi:8-oxo-dGTP pyrophosphatase MutT (NUDIX family)
MAIRYGPWQIQSSHLHYKNEHIEVTEDQVIQPDGQPGRYATVMLKPGIAVLPMAATGEVYLVKQFRYALGKESIEVVSGAIDTGEDALAAAKRELQEELGMEAEHWTNLGIFHMDTSIVKAPVTLFLAKDLTFTEKQEEGSESIQGITLTFRDAVDKVMKTEITHSPSCILLLKAACLLTDVPFSQSIQRAS